jgi:hypothetical protein
MGPYSQQWRQYRRLNRAGFALFAVFIMLLPTVMVLDRYAILSPPALKQSSFLLALPRL